MAARYYLDTCIWRDYYEFRLGTHGRPLGAYATDLILKLIMSKDEIIISDIVVRELRVKYNPEEIELMLDMLFRLGRLVVVKATDEEFREAKTISMARRLPFTDVLHAIKARDSGSIMVTQDKHFKEMLDLVCVKKPQELL